MADQTVRKVVINACFGGFGLSEAALSRYAEITGAVQKYAYDIARDDPALVQVVEELGEAAADSCAELVIASIPADVEWEISSYDGNEHVAEIHRTWYGD